MKNEHKSILYIDDEVNNLISFKATWRNAFSIHTAETAEEGKRILLENRQLANEGINKVKDLGIKVIIADQRMPQQTGVEFFGSIIEEFPHPMRILLTGYADIEVVINAINKGKVHHYISKPWNESEVRALLSSCCDAYTKRDKEYRTSENYRQIFGKWDR